MKYFLILGFLPLLALLSPENGDRTGFSQSDSFPDTTVTVNITGQNKMAKINAGEIIPDINKKPVMNDKTLKSNSDP